MTSPPAGPEPLQSAPPNSKPEETSAPYPPTYDDQNQRKRILGLKVPAFWGLLIGLVLLIAGDIGGGSAAQRSNNSNSNAAAATVTAPSPNEPPGSGRPSS
ncbi:hypothetical protein PG990_002616 [Apiospora arundinis]